MRKHLPKELTSYDFLKSAALILMIVDHIGYYFFPEQLWWRAAGRLSAPIWLFLIGYARSRDLSPRLWIGAAVLLVSGVFVNAGYFPVNILVTIILLRLLIDGLALWIERAPGNLWRAGAAALLLLIPSALFFEYGTAAFALAFCGWLARRKEEGAHAVTDRLQGVTAFTLALYVLMAALVFNFSTIQMAFIAGGCLLIFAYLYGFRPRLYPGLSAALPRPLKSLIQIGGRRTLEIYVLHLLVFKALAVYLGREGFGLAEWRWF